MLSEWFGLDPEEYGYEVGSRSNLRQNVAALLDQDSVFTLSLLPATCNTSCWPMALLCGHADTLLELIADFVGVLRGRQLRNARETLKFLEEVILVPFYKERERECHVVGTQERRQEREKESTAAKQQHARKAFRHQDKE